MPMTRHQRETNHLKIEAFDNANCKIDMILPLASLLSNYDIRNDGFEQFLFDTDTPAAQKELIKCNIDFDEFFVRNGDSDDLEMALETLEDCGINGGYLFKANTPIKKETGMGENHYSFSWGYTTYIWLWAQTVEEGEKACIEWAQRTGFRKKDEE